MSAGVIGIIVGAVISGTAGFLLGVCVGRDSVHVTIRIEPEEGKAHDSSDMEKARGAETEAEV